MTTHGFFPVMGHDGLYIARAGRLNCIAFRLLDGSMCLYSPVAGLELSLSDRLEEMGGVSMILAPNHYHNKGLKGHAAAFPHASLICSNKAKPRLTKITGLTFDMLDSLKSRLAGNQRILEPEGLKTGEIWIEFKTGPETAWIVTDAFSAKLHAPGICAKAPLLLGTFPRYGIKDALAYKEWIKRELTAAYPTMLLSCHGSPVKAPDLDAQLINLLKD